MSREGETLLTQIPILQEGQRGDQRRLDDRLLVEGNKGSLLHSLDLVDDLPQVITRRSRIHARFGTLLLSQGTIEFQLKRREHLPLGSYCGQI